MLSFVRQSLENQIIQEVAFAKVNLTLSILGKRADGYHELSSLVGFADVGDRLLLHVGPSFELQVKGRFADAIVGTNLLEQVAHSLMDEFGLKDFGTLTLEKNLPVAAGIGGGSGDAAALIRIFQRLRGVDFSLDEIAQFGKRFGADVPVCVSSRASMMAGIGEVVRSVGDFPEGLGILLVNPLVGVSTSHVFKELAAGPIEGDALIEHTANSADFTSFEGLLEFMAQKPNDLTEAAVVTAPKIKLCLATLSDLSGCKIQRLSGSGATCFGLFSNKEAALIGKAELQELYPTWWIEAATLV